MNKIFGIDMKWISTAIFVLGGTLVALKLPIMQYAFPFFVVGHSILLYEFGILQHNKPLIIQNAYFMVVNSIATYIWLF
jgi:hypothetical protein